jgi:MFS family permease
LTTQPEVLVADRAPAFLRLYPALRNRHFRLLWLGMLPATVSFQMSSVVLPYAAFELSGSATVVGFVGASWGIPMLLFSLAGGVVADRLPRRSILIATQVSLGLAAAVLAVLALVGLIEIWHLVVVGAIQGTSFAFNGPARQAYIADIVGKPLLRNAVAVNNAGLNFCRIAGPAVAGVLLSTPFVGVGGAAAAMATLYAVVVGTLVRLPFVPPSAPRAVGSSWTQLKEGFAYVFANPSLLGLLGVAFVAIIVGTPYQTLMPVVANREFDAGAAGLGALMASVGVGALAGSLTVATLARYPHPGRLQVGLGISFGVALVLAGLAPNIALAVVAFGLVGFVSAAYTALNSTLMMTNTDPALYGRVMSIYLLTFAALPIGTLPQGWLADQIGARATLVLAGTLVATIVAAVAVFYPPFRRLQ